MCSGTPKKPCGCRQRGARRPTAPQVVDQRFAAGPGRKRAGLPSRRPVLVVDAVGKRALVAPEIAAALARADPGARVVRGDGTLGDASAPDVVMLSGIFGDIWKGIKSVGSTVGKGAAAVGKGVYKAGEFVVTKGAPVIGAGVGVIVGGPAGAAAGAQIGAVVQSTIAPNDRERIQRRAELIAQRFAAIGVQLTPEQAVGLAQESDAVVEAEFARAQRTVAANAGRSADLQTTGYPSGYPTTGYPTTGYPTTGSPTPPQSGGTVTVDRGGISGAGSIPLPVLLGAGVLLVLALRQ